MALTKKDLQLIAETLQPKFDQLKRELLGTMEGLRIYMETRFRDVEVRLDKLEKQNFILRDENK